MNPLGLCLLIVTWARSAAMFKWISGPYKYGFKYIYVDCICRVMGIKDHLDWVLYLIRHIIGLEVNR